MSAVLGVGNGESIVTVSSRHGMRMRFVAGVSSNRCSRVKEHGTIICGRRKTVAAIESVECWLLCRCCDDKMF